MEDKPPASPDREMTEVNEEQAEDFAALLEASTTTSDTRISRDSKVVGTVVSIGDDWVFLDIGGKSEGTVPRDELLDEQGLLPVGVGDQVTAYVINMREGEILLSVKMTSAASEEAIRAAHRAGAPVEGLVAGERKGGYTINLFGKTAFCPYSQMDLPPGGTAADYVDKRLTFKITEYSDRGRNIVLSRREILEEERLKKVAQLKQTLKPGDMVTGTVQKLANFGAFVDIGGIEGLIPMSVLAWHRVAEASDVLSRGEEVTVKILDLDWAGRRISLSLKQTLADPWSTASERYFEEKTLAGTVSKLMNFGAFVELEPGIEGLIHVSNLGMGRRVNHPKEVLSEGDPVTVRVLSLDQGARRIGLELLSEGGEEIPPPKEGDVVTGTVDAVKEYGVFVRLPGNLSGLLHVSEIGEGRAGELRSRFPVGSQVPVQVLSIDAETGKISLSTRSLKEGAEHAQFKDFVSGTRGGSSFGTLGDLLKDKLKE
jgi:small subunit ribosomal protein S1